MKSGFSMLESSSNLVQVVHDIVGSLAKKEDLQSFFFSSASIIDESGTDHLLSFSFPIDQHDPLQLIRVLGKPGLAHFYWEKKDSSLAVAGGKSVLDLKSCGPDRFKYMEKEIARWQSTSIEYSESESALAGLHFLGGFSFFDESPTGQWDPFSAAHLFVPEWCFIRSGQTHLMILTLRVHPGTSASEINNQLENRIGQISEKLQELEWDDSEDSLLSYKTIEPEQERQHWNSTVEDATRRIKNNDFKKIVLARSLYVEAERPIEVTRALDWLRTNYPNCFCFMFQPENGPSLIGCSPERLASFQSRFVLTEALAGSITRGNTPEEDQELEKKLANSEKDQDEHRYVIESIEKRLRSFTNQIDYPAEPGIRKFDNVQHLYTPVTAWIDGEIDIMTLLGALHPTPAVGGFPYEKTIQLIHDMESFERGWYAGPVGWCNSHGRGEFAVAIRSGLIDDKEAQLFAGCGIVEQSNPDAEWDETNLKFIPMLSALKHA